MIYVVYDLPVTPEPEDVERGHIDLEAVGYLGINEAIADLTKRIRFSFGYELHGDDLDTPEPELGPEHTGAIDYWRAQHDSNVHPLPMLRIDSRDYAHVLQVILP